MKLLKHIQSEERRRKRKSAQILAEACIGLSLLTLVWIFLSFSTYMANNKIRAAMAARHAAWLQANGESINSVPGAFFFGGDVGLAKAASGKKITLQRLPIVPLWQGSVWSNSVSFGMSSATLAGTTKYPFVLMKTRLPFMPPSLLDNFLSVDSACGWPGDVGDSYKDWNPITSGISTALPKYNYKK